MFLLTLISIPQWYNCTKRKKKQNMRDCFPWLLNLYSNQYEPSNSKSRFGSAILLKEEHHLKKHITWKSFRTSGKSEASQSPIMMCTLITKKLNPLSYHQLSLPHWDTVTAASHWQRFVVTRQPAVLDVDPILCLDSATSLTKPNKPPQCDP